MARGEGIPVNKNLIVWARERAGLTLDEAGEKFHNIAAWEAGEASPTYPQLEQLADALKLPIAVFFFPEPPTLPPIRESFRTLPDADFDQIPRQVRFLLRKGKALQLNLAELSQGRNPARRLITRELQFPERVGPNVMAARVREYLGITIQEQYAWPDDDAALKAWRSALTDVGVFVFKDAFQAEEYSGFSLYDDEFPIIYVNNSATKTRQIFTLFHELGHLLFHTSGIDTLEDRYVDGLRDDRARRIEILCNRFAAAFLVPAAAFAEALAGREPSRRTAELLASRFHVSREVIFRKFLDRGLIDQATYGAAVAEWVRQQQRPTGSGGDFYWTKIAYLGRPYIALALRQYHQNRIDDVQLAEYLDTKPKNIEALEEYFSKNNQ
jgi:Zn-dependent peptidase ImmA (M78 family)/transcriptional regulator with XRE-family HTH domain